MTKWTMILAILAFLFTSAVTGYKEEGRQFMLDEGEKVVKTDAGSVRVVRGLKRDGHHTSMHLGFISMEPHSLFIPQYIDANLILFVQKGDAKLGWIYKDKLVEKQLKMGDINRIPAGSAFYIVNTGKGQRLHIICSIDTTSDYGFEWPVPFFRSFFLGGGAYPKSVLSGFDIDVLTTAFNVTTEEISAITGTSTSGPIVYITGSATDEPHRIYSILNSKLKEARHLMSSNLNNDEEDNNKPWTITSLINSVFGFNKNILSADSKAVHGPDSYNIYDRGASFKNRFGWTISLDEHDYEPLKHSDIGVYLVNLTAGSMLAPHVNSLATEYGIVLAGYGTVEVVYPNGTCGMKAEVKEGDVFWIPRFFPFCQIASRSGPLVFFGFTTSARTNHPQFLVGASSILKIMMGPELAAGMGVSEEALRKVVDAQKESVILPTWPQHWEKEREKRGDEEGREERLNVRRVVRV